MTSILTRSSSLTSRRAMEPEKSTMQLWHWRRQNQDRLRHLREQLKHEHRPTPIVFASSMMPCATLNMWLWDGESLRPRMLVKRCTIVYIAVPRRTSSEPRRFLRGHFYHATEVVLSKRQLTSPLRRLQISTPMRRRRPDLRRRGMHY